MTNTEGWIVVAVSAVAVVVYVVAMIVWCAMDVLKHKIKMLEDYGLKELERKLKYETDALHSKLKRETDMLHHEIEHKVKMLEYKIK